MVAFAQGFTPGSVPLDAWPGAPGTSWPRPTHTTVITETGARYTFREHGARVYVTSRGSTAGDERFANVVLDEMPAVVVGKRMVLNIGGSWARITSPVVGWERTDILTGHTSTGVDDLDDVFGPPDGARDYPFA